MLVTLVGKIQNPIDGENFIRKTLDVSDFAKSIFSKISTLKDENNLRTVI